MPIKRCRRDPGDQGHDISAGIDQRVDGVAHHRVIERHHSNAVITTAQAEQEIGQLIGIEHVDTVKIAEDTLVLQPGDRAVRLFGELRHEGVAAGRQHESKIILDAAGEADGGGVRSVTQLHQRLLDSLDGPIADAGAPVEHPVDRGEAHLRVIGDVDQSGAAGAFVIHEVRNSKNDWKDRRSLR